MYTVYSVYTIQYTLYTVHYTVYSVYCTIHCTVYSTLYIVQTTVYSTFRLYMLIGDVVRFCCAHDESGRQVGTILLTKITAAHNKVALSYHRVRGLYFLAVIFLGTKRTNALYQVV